MNGMKDLQTALLDLLQKVDDPEIRFIVGGGFGVFFLARTYGYDPIDGRPHWRNLRGVALLKFCIYNIKKINVLKNKRKRYRLKAGRLKERFRRNCRYWPPVIVFEACY